MFICSGLHHEKQSCHSDHIVNVVRNVLNIARETHLFYPQSLKRVSGFNIGPDAFQPNGGWGDVRDHHLCLNFTVPSQPIDVKNVRV